jgi:ribonuclease Z
MRVNKFTVKGRSVSGHSTCVTLPDFGVAFDCGRASHDSFQCDKVLVTHGHLDHFGDVVKQAYVRGMTGMSLTTFVVPSWLEEPVHDLFKFWAKVQGARMAPYHVEVLNPGETVALGGGRYARCFPTFHRVPSQGYVVCETRKRLRDEFKGTSGPELGRMRQRGEVFEDEFEVPLVAFTGDTRAVLFDDPELLALQAKLLVVECTFFNDVSTAEAKKKGHTHLSELGARAHRFENVEALVLTHFSNRYRNADVEAALLELPESLRKKTTFLPMGR